MNNFGQISPIASPFNTTPTLSYFPGQQPLLSNPQTPDETFIELPNPAWQPRDSPQSIKFPHNSNNIFAVVSWDCTARLYQMFNNQVQQTQEVKLPDFPLDCCFINNSLLVILNNNNFYSIQPNQAQGSQIHLNIPDQIFQIDYQVDLNIVFAISQNTLFIFKPDNLQVPLRQFNFPHKIIRFDWNLCDMMLIFGDCKFTILEINSLTKITEQQIPIFTSRMTSPTVACCIDSKGKKFVLGTADGKCFKGVYERNKSNTQFTSYTHKFDDKNNMINFMFIGQGDGVSDYGQVFQINQMGINFRNESFIYTIGSNGALNFWDLKKKNKITSKQLGSPISQACMSSDGNFIVLGMGYDWCYGLDGILKLQAKPRIVIKKILDTELSFAQ